MTASCRLGFPGLIAANRYYAISEMPGQSGNFVRKLFSEQGTVPLVIGWYCIAYLIQSPLIVTDSFGEDEAGYCGAKKFISISLLVSYEFSVIAVFAGGIGLTTFYYFRLAKWLRHNQTVSNRVRQIILCSFKPEVCIETIKTFACYFTYGLGFGAREHGVRQPTGSETNSQQLFSI